MKKKIIIILLVVILLLGLLAGAGALLWFKTDLLDFMKPAKTVWNKQVERALGVEDVKFADYSDVLEDYKDIKDKSFKGKFNISAKLDIDELDSEVQKTINNSKITIETNADVKNRNTQNKIGLYSKDSEVLTMDVVTNGTTVGLGCEDLYDKYVTVSVEDLLDKLQEDGTYDEEQVEMISNILTKSSNLDMYELLYISDDDLKHFDKTYRNALQTMIPKNCYSKKSGVKVEVDGKDEKTTAYYLTLNGPDAYEFVENLTDTVKDDDVLSRLITDKANLVLESTGLSESIKSYTGSSKLKQSQVEAAIDTLCDNLLDELKSIKEYDDSGIKVAVYTKNNKLVKIELIVFNDDDEEVIATAEYCKDKNIYSLYEGKDKPFIVITDEYTTKKDDEKAGTVYVKAYDENVATIDYEIVTKKDENKLVIKADIPSADAKFEINVSAKGNYKKEAVSVNGKIGFAYDDQSAEINFDGSFEYTDDVSVPTLNKNNSVNVLKLSDKELEAESKKILKKASEVLPARLKLIGVDVKAEDIYKEETTTEIKELPKADDLKEELTKLEEKANETVKDSNKLNLSL